MLRLIFSFVVIVLLSRVGASQTFITIDDDSFRLESSTRCKSITSDPQALCDCCVLKQVRILRKAPKYALEYCKKRYDCNDNDELLTVTKRLKAMSIVDVKTLNLGIALGGTLTTDAVASIIKKLFERKLLDLPKELFRDDYGIKIEQLSSDSKGVHTGQLFSVRYDASYLDTSTVAAKKNYRPLYIVKETKKGLREIENLYKVSASILSQEKIATKSIITNSIVSRPLSMAGISFYEVNFMIKNHEKVRYFSVLQTAHGKSFYRYIKQFGKIAAAKKNDRYDRDLQEALQKIKLIFYNVGYALSRLHQKYTLADQTDKFSFFKTYIHGDLHAENIFYDEVSEQVTLIDNETFALSLKRQVCGIKDIVDMYTLHTVHTVAHRFSKQLTTNKEFGINDDLWHELWAELVLGYFFAHDVSPHNFRKAFRLLEKEFYYAFSQINIVSWKKFRDQRYLKLLTGVSPRREYLRHHELKKMFKRIYEKEDKEQQEKMENLMLIDSLETKNKK